jgi:hypothetical protein
MKNRAKQYIESTRAQARWRDFHVISRETHIAFFKRFSWRPFCYQNQMIRRKIFDILGF